MAITLVEAERRPGSTEAPLQHGQESLGDRQSVGPGRNPRHDRTPQAAGFGHWGTPRKENRDHGSFAIASPDPMAVRRITCNLFLTKQTGFATKMTIALK
ncbi:MAG: hypothetical protein H7338_12455 [Candidatus Sericytochromatia bacterium]|nr:hypothetical protein [Candidatus Sericytochromatia bacterium]